MAKELATSRMSVRARALYVVLIVALLVGLAPLQPTGSRQAASADGSGDIAYIYDELGRLVAVVDPDYETAVYSYDETGNILSIARQPSTAVSLIEFAPDWGPVADTEVTIYGTGFVAMSATTAALFADALRGDLDRQQRAYARGDRAIWLILAVTGLASIAISFTRYGALAAMVYATLPFTIGLYAARHDWTGARTR